MACFSISSTNWLACHSLSSSQLKKSMATFDNLPEECIARAISLTSPRDACRLAVVSATFRSAADSDTVWHRFLPSDYPSLLSRAVHPLSLTFSSKKELFFLLSDRYVLIDRGKMSFGLDRSSGARCYMLSPRALSIVWGDTPQYWRWISLPDSRFSEVAELINVYWLEIRGKIQRNLLSCKTTYTAYLIFKVNGNGRSFSFQPQETSVITTSHTSSRTVSLAPDRDSACRNSLMFRSFLSWRGVLTLPIVENYGDDDFDVEGKNGDDEIGFPSLRRDGWMEIELGAFYSGEGDQNNNGEEVEMSFMEAKGRHCKRGLIVQGIEIRPKY